VEAMAIGRPIVTTTAPGCDDCVEEGYNGFKVPVKKANELAEKLKILVQSENKRLIMGKNSRTFFEEEFTLKRVIKQFITIYQNV
jgi:glycosyltransferase involved in cell wall biosynthesis